MKKDLNENLNQSKEKHEIEQSKPWKNPSSKQISVADQSTNAINNKRNEEVLVLRNKFPTKIPVIIKRYTKEQFLPHLDKTKFLVPQEITLSQFQIIVRSRLKLLNSTQALYLLIDNRSILMQNQTMLEIYHEFADADGFLYITYASQEVFG